MEKRQVGAAGHGGHPEPCRHILLRPAGSLTEAQARQRLAEYKRRVQAGQADFAQLARENSQDASARNGGDLGWPARACSCPSSRKCWPACSRPDRRPAGHPPAPPDPAAGAPPGHMSDREQREVVRNLVREEELDEAYVQWSREVRGRAYVELREPPQL